MNHSSFSQLPRSYTATTFTDTMGSTKTAS